MKKQHKGQLKNIGFHHRTSLDYIWNGVLVGIFASLVTVLYRFMLERAESATLKIIGVIKGNATLIFAWFVVLATISFIVARLIRFEKDAGGSGIPQINAEVKGYLNANWIKVLVVKIIGGTLSVFGGLALGREGPSVQLGGMAGKGVAKVLKTDKSNEKIFISCGAGAGLAAAFNAPLAGTMFVLEEIHHTFDKRLLVTGIVATVTSDFVSKIFFTQSTIFSYDTINIPLKYYWTVIIFGIILGLFGVLYNIVSLKSSEIFSKIKLPLEMKIFIPFMLAGVIGFFVPEILGGGHSMVVTLITEHPSIPVMLFLLVTKWIFSAISSGSGAPGGTLYPFLILASYIGAIYGEGLVKIFGLDEKIVAEFIVIAMAGFFAAIVRAPITAIVLAFELTGNMNNLLALAVAAIIAYAVAETTGVKPLYSAMLANLVRGKKIKVKMSRTREKELVTFVIPTGAQISGKKIADIRWGKHVLIASLVRNEETITPKGDTVLKDGDELLMLVSQRRFASDDKRLSEIINTIK